MKEILSVNDDYCFVLEEDGTVVCGDVLNAVIQANEKIGMLMVLKDGEVWSEKKGS